MAITLDGTGVAAQNSVAATTLAVPYPTTGIAAGKVLVLLTGVSSATASTNPGGWTTGPTATAGSSSPALRISVKAAVGTETGSLNVTTPSVTGNGIMLVYGGVDTTTPLDVAGTSISSATATATYVIPTLTTTRPGAALVALAIANIVGGTWTAPTTQGNTWVDLVQTSGAIPAVNVASNIWSSSGATGSVTMTRSSSVRGAAAMIALRPASADRPRNIASYSPATIRSFTR